MSHFALYRKYRSQAFQDLVGQGHVVKTLQNAISSGRIAHAFLFTGPRGTGKTSTARLLAKALNCSKGPAPEPCNECEHCLAITAGTHMDVMELDAASESGVENVREKIVAATEYKPTSARYKVFIIDEVHDLSSKAFDALLKTIEEPPEHIVFILATTEYTKVPSTIRSRCQRYEFHRATLSDLVSRLQYVVKEEGYEAEPAALTTIARMADGGFRDALTLLEQALVTSEGQLSSEHVFEQLGLIHEDTVDELLRAVKENRAKDILSILDQVYRSGRDPRSVLESCLLRLSELTRAAIGIEGETQNDAAETAKVHAVAASLGMDEMQRVRGRLSEAHRVIRDISMQRIWLEAELLSLASPAPTAPARAVVQAPTPTAAQAPAPVVASPPPTPTAPASAPVAPAPTAQPTEPEPPVQTSADPAVQTWHQVVQSISQLSKTAAGRMQRTKVSETREDAVIITASALDVEWMNSKPGFWGTVQKEWEKVRGALPPNVVLEEDEKKKSVPVNAEQVGRPLEGERLKEVASQIFKDF